MSDRGEYRAIRRVLLDGPDFQRLSERARWVFVALKLNIGPTGIEVHYPAALAHQLAAQTGADAEGVVAAMDELEVAGWIRREGNVLWIVGQLTHDPHMSPLDTKHRASIWRHLQGLPRVDLVGEFVQHHAEWFAEGEYTNSKGERKDVAAAPDALHDHLARPYEGPTKALARPSEAPKTEDREPKTDKRTVPDGTGEKPPQNEARKPDPEAEWKEYQPLIAGAVREHAWLGDDPPDNPVREIHRRQRWHMGRELDIAKHLLKQYTGAELLGGMEHFREAHDLGTGQQWSLAWSYAEGNRWMMDHAVRRWREAQMDAIDDPRVLDLTRRMMGEHNAA